MNTLYKQETAQLLILGLANPSATTTKPSALFRSPVAIFSPTLCVFTGRVAIVVEKHPAKVQSARPERVTFE